MISSLHLRALFWITVATWAAMLIVEGQPLTPNLFKPSSFVFYIMLALVVAFEKWIWKWKLLYPWFVHQPDLSGTYHGEIVSHWVDPSTGEKRSPIPATLTIHQTFSNIHVSLHTDNSESSSILNATISTQNEKAELIYTYRNEPQIGQRLQSPIHYGTARLSIESAGHEKLTGSYWTDRGSIGEMNFQRRLTQNLNDR